MAVTTTARFGLTRWSAGTDPFTRAQLDAAMAAIEANAAMFSSGTLAARPAAGKAGRLYQVTDAAAAAPTVFYDTGATWVEIRPDLSAYATSAALTSGLAGKAAAVHTHTAADITGGVFSTARLGTGTANASTVLFGDGTWRAAPSSTVASASDTNISSPAAGQVLQYDSVSGKWVNSDVTTSEVTGLDAALAGKASTSHTHTIADLPVAASGSTSSTQLVRADDSRLSNARTPLAHTHVKADITDFAHTHTVADLPVATSGTVSATLIVRADDARLSDARTPLAHTHAESDITGLVADLAAKAPLAGPAFTGNPTATTQATTDNSTRLATTAFVKALGYQALSAPTTITDWNTATTPGLIYGSGTSANRPTNSVGALGFVFAQPGGTGALVQMAWPVGTGVSTTHVYSRNFNGTTWTAWSDYAPSGSPTLSGTITIGTSDSDVELVRALEVDTDTRSESVTYNTDGTVNQILTKVGSTVVATETFTYVGGLLTQSVLVAGGKTVTETYAYDGSNNYTGTTRSVA